MKTEIKISKLSEANQLTASDFFNIVQSGVNKKITASTMLKWLVSTSDIRLNPDQKAISVFIGSKDYSNLFYTDGVNNRLGVKTSTPQADLHINGSFKVDGIIMSSSEVVTFTTGDTSKALSPLKETSLLDVSNLNGVYTLGVGVDGQTKSICLTTLSSASNATITCSNLAGAATYTITFTSVGQSVTLKYISSISKWICIGNNGATFS